MEANVHTTREFDRLVTKSMADWHVPGLAIAVVRADEIDAKGYGLAKLPDVEVREDTLFDCASTSKSFTAAAISLLVDDDNKHPKVRWETPVSSLLTDFVLQDEYATANVTIEDILSHRSGMPRHDESLMGAKASQPDTSKSATQNLRNLALTYPPKASHLVESLAGCSFEKFLRDQIWDPLGMQNTHLGEKALRPLDTNDRVAQGYCWSRQKQESFPIPWIEKPEDQGAGWIFSTVADYAKWIRMMIKRIPPISEAGHRELVKPRIIAEPDAPKPFHSHLLYALGWEIRSYRGNTVIGHDGSVSGFCSLMRYVPQLDWGVVIFGNSDGASAVAESLFWHLLDESIGVPVLERFPWNAFAREREETDANREVEDLYPERHQPPIPLKTSLQEFVGTYRNAGYHALVVEIRNNELYVDARDRNLGFELVLKHFSGVEALDEAKPEGRLAEGGRGELFVAELIDPMDGEKDSIKAQFLLDLNEAVQCLGVGFVQETEDPMV